MSALKRLTTARIESALPVRGKQVWISDNDGSRGDGRLLLLISPSGTRRFYFRYSLHKQVRTLALGRYSRTRLEGYLTLEEARALVRHYAVLLRNPQVQDLRAAIAAEKDANVDLRFRFSPQPQPELQSHAQSHPVPQLESASLSTNLKTLLDLCHAYESVLAQSEYGQSAKSCKNDTKNYIAPSPWANVPANQFATEQAKALLIYVMNRCSKDKVNRIRSMLMAAYGVAIRSKSDLNTNVDFSNFEVSTNPIVGIQKIKKTGKKRKRTLSWMELGHFWFSLIASPEASTTKMRVIRLSLLLGGQRCLQLLRATTADLDLDSRTLTLQDPKGRRDEPRPHLLPLTSMAMAELQPLLQECRVRGWSHLFHSNRDAPIVSSGVTQAMRELSDSLLLSHKFESPFCYLDIRRTLETRMAELRINKEVRAQLQSHDLGGIQTTIYNQYDFLDQKREALELWQRRLIECAKAAEAVDEGHMDRKIEESKNATYRL